MTTTSHTPLRVHSARRTAQPDLCRRCQALVLIGLNDDQCALTVAIDLIPLTPAAATLAQLRGRKLFRMLPGRKRIIYRLDTWGRPIEEPQPYVEHRCDDPIPDHWRQQINAPPIRPVVTALPDTPQF